MLLKQSLKQTLTQKIDPKIILANTVLAYSNQELAEAIDQELAENPALERPEEDVCGACTFPKELCVDCPLKPDRLKVQEPAEVDWREWYAPETESYPDYSGDDSDFDPIANVCSQRTLQDHLRDLLRNVGTPEQFRLGEYIIGSINQAGYFEGDLNELAADTGVEPQEMEAVLAIIQTFEPAGVGARNLQECLLIQLQTPG